MREKMAIKQAMREAGIPGRGGISALPGFVLDLPGRLKRALNIVANMAQKRCQLTRHTVSNENTSKSLKTNNRCTAYPSIFSRLSAPIFVAVLLLAGGVAIGQNLDQESPAASQPAPIPASCERSVLFNFPGIGPAVPSSSENLRQTPIWQVLGSQAFFFVSGMTIDADGAPNAYHPDNIGLDDIANAGIPGHWEGIITDRTGEPLIQGPDDPYPGYYVSCTSLTDRTKDRTDPERYVDASKIPYIVLPRDVAYQGGAQLGDFAVVVNLRNGKSSNAIFADMGTMGEGSIALANNLGIWSDARQGGRRGGILYLVFPGSGNHQPRTTDEIAAETDKLLASWGGAEKLTSCAANMPAVPVTAAAAAAPSTGPAGPAEAPAAKNSDAPSQPPMVHGVAN